MRKMSIVVAGLLCLVVGEASSQTFERQVLQVSQKMSGAVLQMRQNMAAPQARQGGVSALTPADALDESKVGMAARFISIEPGEFEMGSPIDEDGRHLNEVRHRVKLTKGFEMQATAVTQLQYFLVASRNPATYSKEEYCDKDNFKTLYGRELCVNHPAERVSWDDAQEFIEKINRIQDKCVYRLPTEAEREYATRAGMPWGFPYSFGFNDTNELNSHAWYGGNSKKRTHAVAGKAPNPWGLYDMHGNVWEWVQDWYADYPAMAVTDPVGPSLGSLRVFRGGSWVSNVGSLRSAYRNYGDPGTRWDYVGFRLVRSCR